MKSTGALDFVNQNEKKYQRFRKYTEEDYWTKLWINMSSVEAVSFNADVWMPAGAAQLSAVDSGAGSKKTSKIN